MRMPENHILLTFWNFGGLKHKKLRAMTRWRGDNTLESLWISTVRVLERKSGAIIDSG